MPPLEGKQHSLERRQKRQTQANSGDHGDGERDQDDRRFITVSLTPKGRTFITDLFPKVAASITREFGTLSSAEQFTLGWLCKKVGAPTAATPSTPSSGN